MAALGALGLAVCLALAMTISAPSSAQVAPIVINEIMADNTTSAIDGDGDFSDWIELYNPNSSPVVLDGYQISDDAATWTIPASTTIGANAYRLIWASDKGVPTDPGFPGPAGQLHANFRLTSAGETITLVDAGAVLVDSVTFPMLATDESYGSDGSGSLVIFGPANVTPRAQNAAPATPTPTPPPAAPSLVFSEAMALNATTIADGDGDFSDWFELFNPTCAAIDLTGWQVADTSAAWTIPAGNVMAPGDVLLFWASDKGAPTDPGFPGPAGERHTNFQLASAGETLQLLNPSGALVAQLTTPALVADASYALNGSTYAIASGDAVSPDLLNGGLARPTCTGPTPTPSATPEPTATPPACASIPGDVVINEVMTRNSSAVADGDGDFSDWIELYNPTGTSFDLTGWTIGDPGAIWPFPAGTSITSGGYLLVWASDKGDPTDPLFPGPSGELHANFRLDGAGEIVNLTDSSGCGVDQIIIPELGANETYGYDDAGSLVVFRPGFATPAAVNGATRLPDRAPCFSPDRTIRIDTIVANNNGVRLDADGDDSDFLELWNTGVVAVDLTAWQISDEFDTWIIPQGTIVGGGERITLWASGKGFILDPAYPGPAGELHTSFKLDAGGEQITLAEPSECIVEQFTFPRLRNNQSYSLTIDGSRIVLEPPVAPCAAAGVVTVVAVQAKNDSIRLDEDGDYGDWFELRNTTDAPIDMSGWTLSDDNRSWPVPDGVTIGTDADLLVWADGKDRGGPNEPLHTTFQLSSAGETLTVSSAPGCQISALTFPALKTDETYLLGEDGTFEIQGGVVSPDRPGRPGKEPDGPRAPIIGEDEIVIVGSCIAINELMADNETTIADEDGEFGDWIELANLSAESIDLSGWSLSDSGATWEIPDGVTIEAGGFILVWADDKDRGAADEELHTNFKLSGDGEEVMIKSPDGQLEARVSSYPALQADESFGLHGNGDFGIIEAADVTPADGPIIETGCDFAAILAGADTAEVTDESEASDDEASDDEDADGDGDSAESADGDDETASEPEELAVTGRSTVRLGLLGQVLAVTGVLVVSVAAIVRRRLD